MMAAWMLYAICIGALLAGAAHAAEHAARALRAPTRGVWLLATLATLAAPVAAAVLANGERGDAATGVTVLAPTIILAAGASIAHAEWFAPLGALVGIAWLASSAVAALLLARALLLLHRRRRGWSARRVRGVALLVAPDAGPAVVGVRRMQVVLPEWALALDERLLAMMLRHEAEHVAARDPLLLLAAALALVLTPWNLALWWQARRLRLAIEVDCDARVLRAHGDVERYGLLLLAVAQRRQLSTSMFSPALLEPVSLLERRIAAMTARPARHPRMVAGLGATVAAATLFVACAAPAPDAPGDITSPSAVLTAVPDTPAAALAPDAPRTPDAPRAPETTDPTDAGRGAEWARAKAGLRAGTPASPEVERSINQELARMTAKQPSVVDGPYKEFQVEIPVRPAATSAQPRYPAELKAAGVEGEVLVQFVVDTNGLAIPSTFKLLRSPHALFTNAVREALPQMRFEPADVGGRKVKQLVQHPFLFALSR
jgi:TonB family protein